MKKIEIYQHEIEYYWTDFEKNIDLDAENIEYIKKCIELWYREWELVQVFTDINKYNKPFDHELRWWWKINFNN